MVFEGTVLQRIFEPMTQKQPESGKTAQLVAFIKYYYNN
jgi:hypothetical protein